MRLYAALISLSLIWGMSFMFIKVLDQYMDPWAVVFWRCLFGAGTLFLIMAARRMKGLWRKLPWVPLLIVGVTNAAIPWTLIALSETVIQSGTASVLNATTPIWTSVLGFAIFSVRLTGRQWIGVLIGFVGILILLDFDVAGFLHENFIGVGTMVLAAACYGFATQYTKRFLNDVPVIVTSAATLTVGMILAGLLTAFTGGYHPEVFGSWLTILSMAGLGVFGSGLAYLLMFYMIKAASPEFASFVTYLVPVTAMLWGALLLDEPLSAHLIFGLLFIFGGVYLSSRKPKKQRNSLRKTS